MKTSLLLTACALLGAASLQAEKPLLHPIMAAPEELLRHETFSDSEKKSDWVSRQHTRWEIADGKWVGIPSPPEFQAKAEHHKGLEPRTSLQDVPVNCIALLSIRFSGGEETAVVPFIEFTHHVARLRFTKEEGLLLLGQGESLVLAAAPDFKYEPGRWYHLLAERIGDEFVVQFADGPTLYAKHAGLNPGDKGGAMGMAGPKGGKVEIDNVKIWSVKENANRPGWAERKAGFPIFEPKETERAKMLRKRREAKEAAAAAAKK